MKTHRRRLIPLLGLAGIGILAGCGDDSPGKATGYEQTDGPLWVTAEGEDPSSRWDDLVDTAVTLDGTPEGAEPIPGFEPFNDPRIVLSDGRFIVLGRWDGDEIVASWTQRNPDSVPDGEKVERVDTSDRPIRLFVYDPRTGKLHPVSHIPEVFPYSTAISVGESPDVVLDAVVLDDEQTVAYTTGFSGAAYEIPRDVYVAPIPPA